MLLEIFADRHQRQSTLAASQLPAPPDAILDRLVHSAHRIALKGEPLRKRQGLDLTGKDTHQP